MESLLGEWSLLGANAQVAQSRYTTLGRYHQRYVENVEKEEENRFWTSSDAKESDQKVIDRHVISNFSPATCLHLSFSVVRSWFTMISLSKVLKIESWRYIYRSRTRLSWQSIAIGLSCMTSPATLTSHKTLFGEYKYQRIAAQSISTNNFNMHTVSTGIVLIAVLTLLTASASSQVVKGPTDLVSNDGCSGRACYSAQDCCTPECRCDCVFKAGSSSKVGFCRKVNGRRRRWISHVCFLSSLSILVFPPLLYRLFVSRFLYIDKHNK